jgi:hypothetical protein
MDEAPESGKESLHSALGNWMNEWIDEWMSEWKTSLCSRKFLEHQENGTNWKKTKKGAQFFQEAESRFQILGAGTVTLSEFCREYPQTFRGHGKKCSRHGELAPGTKCMEQGSSEADSR